MIRKHTGVCHMSFDCAAGKCRNFVKGYIYVIHVVEMNENFHEAGPKENFLWIIYKVDRRKYRDSLIRSIGKA
jgi:hypothetical protein